MMPLFAVMVGADDLMLTNTVDRNWIRVMWYTMHLPCWLMYYRIATYMHQSEVRIWLASW